MHFVISSPKLKDNEHVVVKLDNSLGWKVYFLKPNTSFYHHYLYYPDGKPPESVDVAAKTKLQLILLDEKWTIDQTNSSCDDHEGYKQIGEAEVKRGPPIKII